MKKIYFLLVAFCLGASLQAQIINIPDANFKAKLLAANSNEAIAYDFYNFETNIDKNYDGEIQESEALNIFSLNVNDSNISNLTGIEAFKNLTFLNCSSNQLSQLNINNNINLNTLRCNSNQLTDLNASKNILLKELDCRENKLVNLNVSECIKIEMLRCNSNQLTTLEVSKISPLRVLLCDANKLINLDVSNNTGLVNFDCSENNLNNLDVSNNVNISLLDCSFNQLFNLDLSNNLNLGSIVCSSNQLIDLDFSKNTKLVEVICAFNPFTNLDLSHQKKITYLTVNNCPNLEFVNIKNGRNETVNAFVDGSYVSLGFVDCPNLKYVCADGSQIESINELIAPYNYINCEVGNYCSFVPGGDYYTISGNAKLDYNNNGCDANDILFPNLKFNVNNGNSTDSFIVDNSGNYSIALSAGTHTITPVIENPAYFNISPTVVNVTFPDAESSFPQNFCITANSVHNDLEIKILPIAVARPGFDTKYKIIYKNKGTQTQTGSVNLAFDDGVLDYVFATPSTTNQVTNSLSWNFSDLKPFESREIQVTLNVNSPVEIPVVNGDDVLTYTATIIGESDETPDDNIATLNQTVVNSYDPNNKICLEGETVEPRMIGQYVNYMIRFENTGTYPAENVVVKDMIDTEKFDVSTLVPTSSSHSFVTRITNTNQVEFIFENINLPYDDTNNDGYVAFKIKTLPTLTVGHSFENKASIYFDYNAPIVTNKAATTIQNQALVKQDFEFNNYFTLTPNPAVNVLNLNVKSSIKVTSVSVYNVLGQLVMVTSNPSSSIDVSSLRKGNYFIKIVSDKGTSSCKFIKK